MSRQRVGIGVLVSWGSNCYCPIADQILDVLLESPTIVGIVPRGIHVVGATGFLVTFWRRDGHGLRLDHSNKISIP